MGIWTYKLWYAQQIATTYVVNIGDVLSSRQLIGGDDALDFSVHQPS